jgi:hypothetical protein
MKITFGIVLAVLIGYAIARYFPGPGNMIGLP